MEDERPTPVGSPSSDVDESVPLSTTLGVDLEVARALFDVGVLPAMVTPIVDPAVGCSMTPAMYPVPPVLMLSLVDSVPLKITLPAGPAGGGGGPARNEALLGQVIEFCTGCQSAIWFGSYGPGFAVECCTAGGGVRGFPFASDSLTPCRMVAGMVVPGSVVSSLPGDTDVAGGCLGMPDLSLEGPFDVHQDRFMPGASPRVLDGMRGCQYRMTSYDQESGGPDFSPAYGIQLHDPRLLEYVGASESARLLSCSPEYWLHHLGHEKMLAAVLQPQHDAGLILSNVQVLQQFVTSLNRTSSEVLRVAFSRAPFPGDAMQQVVPSYCVRRVAHYMAAMGLWRPPSSQGVWGPLPSATRNACMSCSDCFPDLPQ